MEEMEDSYRSFHDKLSPFLEELVTKLKPDSPPELQFITITSDILRPGDPEFVYDDKDAVLGKYGVVTKVTRLVLSTIGPFLEDGNEDWLHFNSQWLGTLITIADLRAVAVGIDNSDEGSDISAGIGGLNARTNPQSRPLDPQDLENLKAAVSILQTQIIQQTAS